MSDTAVAAPDCPTLRRLAAIRPGERIRYLSDAPSVMKGPACKALIERIHGFVRGLVLAGRIELSQEKYTVAAEKRGARKVTVVEYFATGRERPNAR
jgi:hypothetical protein